MLHNHPFYCLSALLLGIALFYFYMVLTGKKIDEKKMNTGPLTNQAYERILLELYPMESLNKAIKNIPSAEKEALEKSAQKIKDNIYRFIEDNK